MVRWGLGVGAVLLVLFTVDRRRYGITLRHAEGWNGLVALQRLQGVLKKTIIFITHDFDEAIRLADRIAIMKDGAVIQIGTPEELVLHPATDYVAEFTRDVQRSKVMSVRSMMQPLDSAHTLIGQVRDTDKIGAVAGRIIETGKPFAVIDDEGRLVGEIAPGPILDMLLGRGNGAAS